jgi:hypothetical protein
MCDVVAPGSERGISSPQPASEQLIGPPLLSSGAAWFAFQPTRSAAPASEHLGLFGRRPWRPAAPACVARHVTHHTRQRTRDRGELLNVVGRLAVILGHARDQTRRLDSRLVGPWGAVGFSARRIRRARLHRAHSDVASSRAALARGCDENRVTEPSRLHRRLGGIREFAGFPTASGRSLDGRAARAVGRRAHMPGWLSGSVPRRGGGHRRCDSHERAHVLAALVTATSLD